MDDKYVVLKTADLRNVMSGDVAWIKEGNRRVTVPKFEYTVERYALDDAVVIRTQDVFAAAGLSAYAQNIRTHVALMRTALLPDMTDSFHALEATDGLEAADEMIARLEAIARYFEEMAQEAEDRITRGECKVPD